MSSRSANSLWKNACDRLALENEELYDSYIRNVEDNLKQKVADRSPTSKKGLGLMTTMLLKKAHETKNKSQNDTLRSILRASNPAQESSFDRPRLPVFLQLLRWVGYSFSCR